MKKNEFGFGTLNLQVMTSTATEKNDGYIVKLQHSSTKNEKTPFGVKTQKVQHTFYMKLDDAPEVGFKADMNLDEWRITERPYIIDDETSDMHGQTIMLKWLHM